MKRILSLLLSVVMLLGLCACGNKNNPDATAPGEPIEQEATICVNDNEELQLLDYYNIEELQGNIDSLYKHYTYYAFESDGKLYEYDSATPIETKDEYVVYDLKENTVLSYNETAIVIQDKNDTLTALVPSNKNVKKHTAKINTISIEGIKPHEFWQCEADEKQNWVSVVYKQNDNIMYTVYQFDGTIVDSGNIQTIMDEKAQEFKLSDYVYSNDGEIFALNEHSAIRTFELRVWRNEEKEYTINCYLNDYGFDKFNDWSTWIKLDHSFQWALINNADPNVVNFYQRTGNLDNYQMNKIGSVELPSECKDKTIAACYSVLNATIVMFSDNQYYKLDHAFEGKEFSREPSWTKLAGLSKIAYDKEVFLYGPWLCVLESDGKLYTYNHI